MDRIDLYHILIWVVLTGFANLADRFKRYFSMIRGDKMSNHKDVVATILSLEQAALDRWGQGDPSGFLELSSPNVVYFDPFIECRIDGLEALTAYYESLRGKVKIDYYELINPKVQVGKDIVVLTFNYKSVSGTSERRWNCTEVYQRTEAGCRIIQTHWSITQPIG